MNRNIWKYTMKYAESLAHFLAKIDNAFHIFNKEINDSNLIIGHGDYRYKINKNWGTPLNKNKFPVNDCHEMAIDKKNRLFLLTNHPKNNVLIYNLKGEIINSWTLGFKSAHGLTLNSENNIEYLYITDPNTETVVKTDLDGNIILKLTPPTKLGAYKKNELFFPTETAVAPNGDIYVADAYGSSYITQYDKNGNFIRIFGGKGSKKENLNESHGITIDTRTATPTLIISSRVNCSFKRFTLDGKYISTIKIPGAYVCKPVIYNDNLYAGVCWSGLYFLPNTGFITILDKNDKVISTPGANEPIYVNGKLKKLYQKQYVFKHCHDVCIDSNENIYVAQWNAGQSYPIKLERIK